MTAIHPHINFNGNAFEAFTFYQSVLGGLFTKIIRFKDLASDAFEVAETEKEKIMLIVLAVNANCMIMANDVPAFMGQVNENENRSKIFLAADTLADADGFFAGLSQNGTVEMGMSHSPWGTYFGMFRDKYGIEWMIEVAGEN